MKWGNVEVWGVSICFIVLVNPTFQHVLHQQLLLINFIKWQEPFLQLVEYKMNEIAGACRAVSDWVSNQALVL